MPTALARPMPLAAGDAPRIPWFTIVLLAFYAAAAVAALLGILVTDTTVAAVAFP